VRGTDINMSRLRWRERVHGCISTEAERPFKCGV